MHSKKELSKNVENEPIFQEFCSNRELGKSSIRGYKYALQKYSDFTNKTLDELIEEAEDEMYDNVKFRKRKINSYLNGFKSHLEELGVARSSKNHIIMLVRSFYNEFDIQLPRLKRKKSRKASIPETIEVLPTMDEIKKFMEYCNNVYKAIVLTGLSSGMSRAELSSLTFKHFYNAMELDKYPIDIPELIEKANPKVKREKAFVPLWQIKRIKTDHPYFTFSSPESIDRIIVYLEDLNYKFPDFKPNLNDKLFRSLKTNNPLTTSDIGGMYVYINKKRGFRKNGAHYVIRPHSLRKLFASTLEKARVQHLTTRWLLGHSIDRTTSAYFKADPEALKEEYVEVLDQLTTDKVQIKIINKYEEIKQDFNALNRKFDFVIDKGRLPEEYRDMILQDQRRQEAEFERQIKREAELITR